jgi:hypothetical protein
MNNIPAFPTQAPADQLAQLEVGERLFLWGFRTMAQHRRCACPIAAEIRQIYGEFLVEDAVALLETVIDVFASTAHTAIAVHGPCCPCVSDGEMSLCRAMAAAQSGDPRAARQQFEHWLPELAADWILAPASEFGSIFQTAGMELPRRDFGAMNTDGARRSPSWSAGSEARH